MNFCFAVCALFIALFAAVISIIGGMDVPVEDESPLDRFLPVNTETKAMGFTYEIMDFPCEGNSPDGYPLSFRTSIPYDQELNKYGYYGNTATTLLDGVPTVIGFSSLVECLTTEEWYDEEKTKPKSGHVVFQFMFDPNNGFIQQLQCDYTKYPDYCPKDEDGDYIFIPYSGNTENPDYETYKALPYAGN